MTPDTAMPLSLRCGDCVDDPGHGGAGVPTGVFAGFVSGKIFSYVITVCDTEAAERCPIFPGVTERLHWSFPDPAQVQGSQEEKLAQVRQIRDAIRTQIEQWVAAIPG